jgi:hypothetical protein
VNALGFSQAAEGVLAPCGEYFGQISWRGVFRRAMIVLELRGP